MPPKSNIIGRWRKQPRELLRYEVDWSKWLLPSEIITTASVVVLNNTDDSPLEVTVPYLLDDSLVCVFFAKGGLDKCEYQVTHRVTTSMGQTAEREIIYIVEEV